jgi:ApbE superfamily uncharacterized protein (UPF0280 family)
MAQRKISMKSLFRKTFQQKESNCSVITDKLIGLQTAEQSIEFHRKQLEKYIETNPRFLYSLEPISAPRKPLVANLMAKAAEKAGVGPMAAVAGVLADLGVRDMLKAGCSVAVVENGGEISASSSEAIDVAVAVGDEPLSKRFGFRLTNFPIGIATSSGRFSHALSFGDAEAATIFCKDAGLADAAATAVGNVVKGENHGKAIHHGLNRAMSIKGVKGALIICGGQVGTAGHIPRIIKIQQ